MKARTGQQEAFCEAMRSGSEDVALIARAGSGKTFTILEAIRERPPSLAAMLCAFSKPIAVELGERLAGVRNAQASTLHGIGFRAVRRAARGRQVKVKADRERDLASRICGEQMHDDVLDAVAGIAVKAKEIAPDEADSVERLADIAIDFGHGGDPEDDHGWDVWRRARAAAEVVAASREFGSEISFADMLYLPLALRLQPDRADIVCIDEAQDMNLAQLRLAARVRRKGGRIFVVGDPRQAIYSWRGAAPGALDRVADALKARRLSLTVTFRCARAIVEAARAIVPDLEAAPGAPAGIVRDAGELEMYTAARPGDFVLSRSNAPLARTCLGLIRQGTPAYIVGNDMGAGLVRLIERLTKSRQLSLGVEPVAALLRELEAWRAREARRAQAVNRPARAELVNDQAAMITAIAEDVDEIDELIAKIRSLFSDDDGRGRRRVACSTIHRAKGLEADRVWVLQKTLDMMRPSTPLAEVEEANLKYVAITRARHELVWVQQ